MLIDQPSPSQHHFDEPETAILGHMPVFRPGDTVRYGNSHAVVEYVILRKGELMVRLQHYNEPVRAEALHAPRMPVVWRRKTNKPLS